MNFRTREFKKLCADLPREIQDIAEAAFKRFLDDPHALQNHILPNKRRLPRPICHAVSITRRYRALYFEDGDVNIWFWIGSHEDYNNLIA